MEVAKRRLSAAELLVVLVLLVAVALISVPQFTKAADEGPYGEVNDALAELRLAIDAYHQHRGVYPSLEAIAFQLTSETDWEGLAPDPAIDDTDVFGPYLREIPAVNIDGVDRAGIGTTPGPGVGWLYDEDSGFISPAATNTDAQGRLITRY